MQAGSKPRKLLVVDDEVSLRRTVIKSLAPLGYEFIECDNSVDGVEQARKHFPDLIISDISMAGGDGYSLLDQLRKDPLLASIPVILMTGQAGPESMRRGMEHGADDYLPKPFTMESLRAAVEARFARRQADESTPALLLEVLEATSDLVCVARLSDHRILHLNRAGRNLIGLSTSDALPKLRLDDLYASAMRDKIFESAIPAAKRHRVWAAESTLQTRDGREIPVSQVLVIHADHAGESSHVSVVARDLSERIRSEQALNNSFTQLRELASRLVSAQEEERARIAREIHDEFGQQLTGLNINLAWLEKRVRENKSPTSPAQLLDKISVMQDQIKTTIKTLRRIATDLRPGILDSLGLVAALEWQAKEFSERTGIQCVFRPDREEISCGQVHAITLFRIFQETLTNVARHANATSVEASLGRTDSRLHLRIRDNGRGISDTRQVNRKSLGLLGMKERAAIVGGTFKISSKAGNGTLVEVEIPVEPKLSSESKS